MFYNLVGFIPQIKPKKALQASKAGLDKKQKSLPNNLGGFFSKN